MSETKVTTITEEVPLERLDLSKLEPLKKKGPPKVYLAVRSSPETVGGGHECRTFATFNAAKAWGVGPWAEDLNIYCVELSDDVDWAGVEPIYQAKKWSG